MLKLIESSKSRFLFSRQSTLPNMISPLTKLTTMRIISTMYFEQGYTQILQSAY